jgi:hypothetical protein
MASLETLFNSDQQVAINGTIIALTAGPYQDVNAYFILTSATLVFFMHCGFAMVGCLASEVPHSTLHTLHLRMLAGPMASPPQPLLSPLCVSPLSLFHIPRLLTHSSSCLLRAHGRLINVSGMGSSCLQTLHVTYVLHGQWVSRRLKMYALFVQISIGSVRAQFAKHISILILVDACASALGFYIAGYAFAFGDLLDGDGNNIGKPCCELRNMS